MTDPENKSEESNPAPRPFTSDELRTFLAGQRTLLAWIRTALAMMGFGFLVARFGLFLRQLAAIQHTAPRPGSGYSLWMGTALVLIGVMVNIFAAYRYIEFSQQFSQSELGRPRAYLFETGLAVALALFGVLMAIYLIMTTSP